MWKSMDSRGPNDTSLLYLSAVVERRKEFNCTEPFKVVNNISTHGFWSFVEAAFVRQENLSFDRLVFLITRQLRGETLKHSYEKFCELADNCVFDNEVETLIRYVFNLKLIFPENSKLPKEIIEPLRSPT